MPITITIEKAVSSTTAEAKGYIPNYGMDFLVFKRFIINPGGISEIEDKWKDLIRATTEGGSSIQDAFSFLGDLGKFLVDQGGAGTREYAPFKNDIVGYDDVLLPFPNEMSVDYSGNFDKSELTLEQTLLNTGVSNLSKVNAGLTTAFTNMVNFASNVAERNGLTINKHILNVYKGANPRTINLGFVIVPNNVEEYERFRNCINALKVSSLASTKKIGGVIPFLQQRFVFTIGFVSGGKSNNMRDKMNKIINETLMIGDEDNNSGFYINSIEVQYGDNNALFYERKKNISAPKKIQVSISLVERKPLYSKDIKNIAKIEVSR